MIKTNRKMTGIRIHQALKFVGIIAGTWALLLVLITTLTYLPGHPDFSIFSTYLSDMSDSSKTPGWPPIIFNAGTLIAVPLRYLVIVLLVWRLSQLGAGRGFSISALILGFFSTAGTALMTAVPFGIAPTIHKLGIVLYFLGVVFLQTLIGIKEISLKKIPRILPVLSFSMVVLYLIFTILMILFERGMVERSTPVIWEWLAFFSSILWVFTHGILLGKADTSR